MRLRRTGLLFCLLLTGRAAFASQADPGKIIDFVRDIQPVLETRCLTCHGPQQQMNGLRLDRRDDAMRGSHSGPVIRPGDSKTSKLYQLITTGIQAGNQRLVMPPTGPLSSGETELFRRWIDQGAAWPKEAEALAKGPARPLPWSFTPIRRPGVPASPRPDWVRNPIDAFILARLASEHIDPSPAADRSTLMRRLYLDLTGLPPTPDEATAFLADQRADAYERLVDHLLQSPHFGEKWARQWLDLARYADSEGGIQDYVRPYAWRYREWVIDALNQDMPFDQFTIEQMAGDLLPGPTVLQKLATGFHRNTVTSREGGIDLEELRFAQLIDRTNTLGTTWLGLTVGCAQCHDHKYDPIKQRDYYRLLAFFQNGMEVDVEAPLPGELGPYRRHIGEYREERRTLLEQYGVSKLQAAWEDDMRYSGAHPGKRTDLDGAYDRFCKMVDNGPKILQKAPASRTRREQDTIADYFVRSPGPEVGDKLKPLAEKLTALSAKYPSLSEVMTLAEDTAQAPTYIRLRGNFKDQGAAVTPGTPEALSAPSASQPSDRLALARWLVSRDNPLTARVAVNRMWQELFGRGLVSTSEDFGNQGEKPTHPELLDWLASEFVERGWSRKAICRLIVTSSTYRQRSEVRADLANRDPENTLLARQTRLRLPAELIRDSALQTSGLLLDTVGGPSVRPPQPEGVTDLVYSFKWAESAGESRYRRGIYVQTQRTAMYPLLMNFDSPDRTVTCSRREISNTPLQALNLLNDPVFTEAAQALAARVLREASGGERIERAFRICFARSPSPAERDAALSYLDRRRRLSAANPKALEQMPTADLEGVDPAEAVAWFGFSRALINTDEFLTRE